MRYIFFAFFLILIFPLFSQERAVEWSELARRKGQLLKFLQVQDNGSFYSLRWSGSRMFGNYLVVKHDDNKVSASTKIKMHINNSMCTFVGVDLFQGKCAVFLSDFRENSNILYLRQFSEDLSKVEQEIELASYEFEKGHQKGLFGVRFSADRKFMAVVWEKPGKKNNEHIYGYKVFNEQLEVVHEGEYPLPYRPDLSEIQGHFISNRGDYFVAVTEFDLDTTKLFYRNQRNFKSLHLFHLNQTGLLDYTVDLDSRRIYTLTMSSDDSSLVHVSGLYGLKDEVGIRGVFFQKLDLLSESKVNGGFCELKTDIITEGWTDRAKKRLKRKEERGKEEAIFFNYEMRESITLPDSSIVGSMEQHYIQERLTDVQQSGMSSNTFYYYYNDIIVYRIGKKGEFDWIKKIRKYQVSTNDGGPFSGFISYQDSTHMYFLFNDHVDNYDSTGRFIEADEVYITNYGRRKNVVAYASIDLLTGEIDRHILHRRNDKGFLFIPKLCMNATNERTVVLYGLKGQRETIGTINY